MGCIFDGGERRMLDINLIRNNPEIVKRSQRRRGESEEIVDKVLEVDKEWREKLKVLNSLRAERNRKSAEATKAKQEGDLEKLERIRREVRELGKKIKELEEEVQKLKKERDSILMRIPNILADDVPPGVSEEDNVPIRFWGKFRVWKGHEQDFLDQLKGHSVEYELIDWRPKSHVDLLAELDIGDIPRAAKVSGARFFYLKNELALLDLALVRFAMERMIKKGYIPVIPPYMLSRRAMEGVTDLSAFEEMLYKIEGEDLYLIATAEHSIGAMFMNEILEEKDLPLKFVGFSPCFRKEAGAHGKDTKGIFRVHQFHKVEQFVFSTPEQSWEIHEEIVRNAEELFQELGIPYRVVNICAGEMGAVAAKKYDIEAWMPAQGKFREVVSASNCTDYQARRLRIRYRRRKDGEIVPVHTLNSTALATTRTCVAILENFQEPDGTVKIPRALWKYMGGIKEILPPDRKDLSKRLEV